VTTTACSSPVSSPLIRSCTALRRWRSRQCVSRWLPCAARALSPPRAYTACLYRVPTTCLDVTSHHISPRLQSAAVLDYVETTTNATYTSFLLTGTIYTLGSERSHTTRPHSHTRLMGHPHAVWDIHATHGARPSTALLLRTARPHPPHRPPAQPVTSPAASPTHTPQHPPDDHSNPPSLPSHSSAVSAEVFYSSSPSANSSVRLMAATTTVLTDHGLGFNFIYTNGALTSCEGETAALSEAPLQVSCAPPPT
jgi:hypothetical protein